MKVYQPQPGTIPSRVYEWMLTMKPGTEKTSAEIAEELGQPVELIPGALAFARSRGLFNARKDGKFLYWSIAERAEPKKGRGRPLGFRACCWDGGRIELHVDGKSKLLTRKQSDGLRELLRGQA